MTAGKSFNINSLTIVGNVCEVIERGKAGETKDYVPLSQNFALSLLHGI